MKRILLLLSLLTASVITNGQQSQYFDAPFGGGGGFTGGWTFSDVTPLNNILIASDMPVLKESGVFTTGGSGFIYVGFVPFLRVGGMGFGGSTSTRSGMGTDGFYREVEYSIGGGGLTVEYSIPLVRNIGISIGAILGAGGIQVDIYKNTGFESWVGITSQLGSGIPSGNNHRTINNSFFIFTPTLNVDIPITRFINFRAGTGYQITVAEDWKADNDLKLVDTPSGLNGRAFFIQAGIFAGFFSF